MVLAPGRLAGGMFNQFLWFVSLALLMHVFSKPAKEILIVASSQLGLQPRLVQNRPPHQLSSIEIAKCIGRKIAERSRAPMNVLQAPI